MVIPSFLLLLFMVIIPILTSVRESVTDENGLFTLEHYASLFTSKAMRSNILFTLNLTTTSSVLALLISYAAAVYLRFGTGRTADMIRKLYLIPMFVPSVIATYGIMNMYGNHGWIARVIEAFGGEGFVRIIFDYKGLLLANLWFNVPFATMLLHAALSGIPNSMIESAKDAGAGKLAVFLKFVLPLTFKSMLVASTFIFMGVIGSFTAPFLIGPNAPQVLGVAMQQVFSVYQEIGQASAIAVFMFALCAVMGYFYIHSMIKEDSAAR